MKRVFISDSTVSECEKGFSPLLSHIPTAHMNMHGRARNPTKRYVWTQEQEQLAIRVQ